MGQEQVLGSVGFELGQAVGEPDDDLLDAPELALSEPCIDADSQSSVGALHLGNTFIRRLVRHLPMPVRHERARIRPAADAGTFRLVVPALSLADVVHEYGPYLPNHRDPSEEQVAFVAERFREVARPKAMEA